MNISMEVLSKELCDCIDFQNIQESSEMTIRYTELYDQERRGDDPACVYLCDPGDGLPPPAEGVNFIFSSGRGEFPEPFKKTNYIVTKGISYTRLVNRVFSIFEKYNQFEKEMDDLLMRNAPLGKILDLAAQTIGYPLSIQDINYNILAVCSCLDSPGDELWEALNGKVNRFWYEIAQFSRPNHSDVLSTPGGCLETTVNFTGRYIILHLIYNEGKPIACMGMHRTGEYMEPFEKVSVQLYKYAVAAVSKRLQHFPDLKMGRGLLHEHILSDLINGKVSGELQIEEMIRRLNIVSRSKFQLVRILLIGDVVATYRQFAMMDHLEIMIPESKAVMIDGHIDMLYQFEKGVYMPEALCEKLVSTLKIYNSYCLVSPAFRHIEDLQKIALLLGAADASDNYQHTSGTVIHCHEFVKEYFFKQMSENIPLNLMTHPIIDRIKEYDKENGTEYYRTFYTYLRNNCNATRSAQLLHLHPNTMLYRVNRIEEILGVTVEEWNLRSSLLFFLDCEEYSEKNQRITQYQKQILSSQLTK
jgi:hypothetical protein